MSSLYSITVFQPPRWWEAGGRYAYDNKIHRRFNFPAWEDFRTFLYKLAERPLPNKQAAQLISPAIYRQSEGPDDKVTRSNRNVVAWAGWAAVDVDSAPNVDDLPATIHSKLGKWNYIVYSTASSKVEQPKYRIVIDLSRDVQVAEIRHFWFAVQSLVDSQGDKQCKDFSRMYYIPATYEGAHNFIFHNDGAQLDVDHLLATTPYNEAQNSPNFLDRLDPQWQSLVIEHRKGALTKSGDINWVSYRDCPFVSKRQIDSWMAIANVDGSGRYRMVYKMMVDIAMRALKRGYPITADQLVLLIRQIDADSSNKYQSRPLDIEANNALEFAYRHVPVSSLAM